MTTSSPAGVQKALREIDAMLRRVPLPLPIAPACQICDLKPAVSGAAACNGCLEALCFELIEIRAAGRGKG